ncbi:MAG TPA: EAL domain-containing protein [Thiopseudomonas sp.]|nr:EAL domain-containing protein [Thiopseudomonas sp.]
MLIVAQSTGMQVIAEGVETIEQVNSLRDLGCTQGQGYWYAKPLLLCELKELLKQKAGVM